jgi:succinate dehydrogenase / fumarate reductase, cytochrome b subunit
VKNDTRPINVGISDLMVFGWPITAIASISHRVAGMGLFIGMAIGLYALEASLSSESGFLEIKAAMASPIGMIVTIGLLAALAYHFVAGIKHLVLDLGFGETFEGGVFAAKTVLLVSAILIFLSIVWVVQG